MPTQPDRVRFDPAIEPSMLLQGGIRIDLGGEPAATTPPEARGFARDEVRLLVASDTGIEHVRFRALPQLLRAGDLLVVNTSATLAAALDGERIPGGAATVHFSTALDDGAWLVEVRPRIDATGPVADAALGERIVLPDGAVLTLRAPYAADGPGLPRLWEATLAGADAHDLMRHHGRPIAYAYIDGAWPIAAYQTVFAMHPGSAEMPSAGRPFSHRLVSRLIASGIDLAPIVLHSGVSSFEAGEPPLAERYAVPAYAAARINATRAAGGRIIAVGTTVARAIESSVNRGRVTASAGWTDLVLGPDREAQVLDGIITGWHTAGASHLRLLEAVAGPQRVAHAYDAAHAGSYLWHEFGDSCLLLRS